MNRLITCLSMKNKKILTDVLLKNEQAEDTWEYKHLKIMPNSRSSHERISVLKKKNEGTSLKMKQIQMAMSHTNGSPEWLILAHLILITL